MITYNLPQWMTLSFLVVIPIPFILIPFLAKKGAPIATANRTFWTVLLCLAAYFAYIIFASQAGLFSKVSFPPMVLLLTTFLYAALLFGVVMNLTVFKNHLAQISLTDLVRVHIFRFIGVFFILIALHDALPKWFAFIAGLGDVITAISSIFVANALENKAKNAQKWAFAWNIFGAVDIMFTAVTANVLTKISISTGAQGVDALAQFPFCIIPAFAPPTILLLHYCIFKKLRE
jgi:hypothetical protein